MTEYTYKPASLVESFQNLKESLRNDRSNHDADEVDQEEGQAHGDNHLLVVAATQLTAAGLDSSEVLGFLVRAQHCVQAAARAGANLILLPELFLGPYFCQSQQADLMALAEPVRDNFLIRQMRSLAQKHRIVLPISFYERHNNAYYNTVAVIDADGSVLDTIYRKSHIPDGTGYQEKFYFSPGDTGFRVFETMVGKIGIAICWDQWFPEVARSLALQGAEVILYPTAIGSEPQDSTIDSSDHWQRVMQGHSAANMIPVVASNRYGTEILLREDGSEQQRITFYGRSFVTDNTGGVIAECIRNTPENPYSFVLANIDTERNRKARAGWGLFRDRRPDLYSSLLTKDGVTRTPP